MPSRHRPKPPPPPPLSDLERFAQAVRESEEAARRAKQSGRDRKAAAERRKIEAIEYAAKLERAKADHKRAVEMVKEAQRSGKGAAAADLVWRKAKAHLIEMETGARPSWDHDDPAAHSSEADDEAAEPTIDDQDDD